MGHECPGHGQSQKSTDYVLLVLCDVPNREVCRDGQQVSGAYGGGGGGMAVCAGHRASSGGDEHGLKWTAASVAHV